MTAPSPAILDHARRALTEAGARGWRIHLDPDGPVLMAPVATLSPALVERLVEFIDAVAHVLVAEQEFDR